jgi:diketogulonate reductase-like aldo/keto reductase
LGVNKVELWSVILSSLRTDADKEAQSSGYSIPSIAYGTFALGDVQAPVDQGQIDQALDNGYNHIGE